MSVVLIKNYDDDDGHFEAKFYVEGLQFAPISMDGGMVIQLCRWTFSHKQTL